MFRITRRKDKRTELEREVDKAVSDLIRSAEKADEIERAVKVASEWESNRRKIPKLSPDTVALIAANLVGIILILGYEKADVITSKALGFILRGRG